MNFLIAPPTAIILWFGGQDVMAGSLTIGTLVAFNSYVLLLTLPVARLGFLVNLLSGAVASADRLFEILNRPSAVQEAAGALVLDTLRGDVRFEHVDFAYGDISGVSNIGPGGAARRVVRCQARPGRRPDGPDRFRQDHRS